MNRTLVGVVLLVVLLAGGIAATVWMDRSSAEIAALLDSAGDLAASGDGESGAQKAWEAYTIWQRRRNLGAVFTDHAPMEQVDWGFARLEFYGKTGEWEAFAPLCVELAEQLRAIGEAQGVSWWNLL